MSPIQYFVYRFLSLNHTYAQLQKFEGLSNPKTIVICIKRLAYGLYWAPGESHGGQWPYLCPHDEIQFAEELSSQIESGEAQPTSRILLHFQEVAQERHQKALIIFANLKSWKLYSKSFNTIVSLPHLSYLYAFMDRYKKEGFELLHMDEIEIMRVVNSCPKILRPWYHKFLLLKQAYRDICICGADEMGIDLSSRKVNFLTKRGKRITIKADPQFPHTTVMFTHFMGGASLPPFIIMPGISEKKDLQEMLKIQGVYLASNSSGWMTEAMFTLWCLYFTFILTQYKFQNNIPIDEKVLLILDGHSSRSNVLGLEILKNAKVDVLTLLSHTSHVSQMFDVQLAAPLKLQFSRNYNIYIDQVKDQPGSRLHKERIALIQAVRDAWGKVANPQQCIKSGETAGYCVQTQEELEEFLSSHRVSPDKLADRYRPYTGPKNQETHSNEVNIQAMQTTDLNSEFPDLIDIDRNPPNPTDEQQELIESVNNTVDTFSRLVISGKILTKSKMITKIRALKESRHGDKCLHVQFPDERLTSEAIESWIPDFFAMLAKNHTFMLSQMPNFISQYTNFPSVNPLLTFLPHLESITPEALLENEALTFPKSSQAKFPAGSKRFCSNQIAFIPTDSTDSQSLEFPKVPSIFRNSPNNENYHTNLTNGIHQLDKDLTIFLLRLILHNYPYEDQDDTIPISSDFPYTSAIVNELHCLGNVFEKHPEIFQIITKEPLFSKTKHDQKREIIKASTFLHESIISLIESEEGNIDALKELDQIFLNHIVYDWQKENDECEQYLKNQRNQKKLERFSPEVMAKFETLGLQEQVAILELRSTIRINAINMPSKYFQFFCKLNPTQRVIFLGNRAETAFTVFLSFKDNDWKDIATLSLPQLKCFVEGRFKTLQENMNNEADNIEDNEIENNEETVNIKGNEIENNDETANIEDNDIENNDETANIEDNDIENNDETANINNISNINNRTPKINNISLINNNETININDNEPLPTDCPFHFQKPSCIIGIRRYQRPMKICNISKMVLQNQ